MDAYNISEDLNIYGNNCSKYNDFMTITSISSVVSGTFGIFGNLIILLAIPYASRRRK